MLCRISHWVGWSQWDEGHDASQATSNQWLLKNWYMQVHFYFRNSDFVVVETLWLTLHLLCICLAENLLRRWYSIGFRLVDHSISVIIMKNIPTNNKPVYKWIFVWLISISEPGISCPNSKLGLFVHQIDESFRITPTNSKPNQACIFGLQGLYIGFAVTPCVHLLAG